MLEVRQPSGRLVLTTDESRCGTVAELRSAAAATLNMAPHQLVLSRAGSVMADADIFEISGEPSLDVIFVVLLDPVVSEAAACASDLTAETDEELGFEEACKYISAAEKLGQIGGEIAAPHAPALAARLDCNNHHVQCAVIRALVQIGGRAVADGVAARLSDGDSFARAGAIEVLHQISVEYVEPHVAALAMVLQDSAWEVRCGAAAVLMKLKKSTFAPFAEKLAWVLEHDDPVLHGQINHIFKEIDASKRARALSLVLSDVLRCPREAAAKALLEMGPSTIALYVPLLTSVLNHSDNQVRCQVRLALGRLNFAARVAAFAASLEHPCSEVRQASVIELGALAADVHSTDAEIHVLINHSVKIALLLYDHEKNVRKSAADAFGKLPAAASAICIPVLASGIENCSIASQEYEEALRSLRDEQHAAGLEAILQSPAWKVRSAAAEGLGNIGHPCATSACKSLSMLLRDDHPQVRQRAARALQCIGGTAAAAHCDALFTCLSDDDQGVRKAAAWALGDISGASVKHVEALVALLWDKDPSVRCAAAQSVGAVCSRMHGKMYVPDLASAKSALALRSRQDDAASVRAAASNALQEIAESVQSEPSSPVSPLRSPNGSRGFAPRSSTFPVSNRTSLPSDYIAGSGRAAAVKLQAVRRLRKNVSGPTLLSRSSQRWP